MGHGQVAEFIMEQCWRGLGRGQLFLRRDGLENTPERVAARHAYLEAYPETRPEYRRAILEAGVTPGMMRRETVAAWGLDEKELRSFSCRMTASLPGGAARHAALVDQGTALPDQERAKAIQAHLLPA